VAVQVLPGSEPAQLATSRSRAIEIHRYASLHLMRITARCFASRRPMLARASTLIAARWPAVSDLPVSYLRHRLKRYASMSCRLRRFMPMTRRFQCSPQATAGPRPAGYGLMCAMNEPPMKTPPQPCGGMGVATLGKDGVEFGEACVVREALDRPVPDRSPNGRVHLEIA
jgi:hypothetical protein